jgi:hypothetical protein
MSVYRWYGLSTIKIGATALASVGNYMPSTFTTIQNFVPDSARLIFEAPDDQRIYVEDSNDPDITLAGGDAAKTIEFATRDMSLSDTFVLGFGGSTDGTVYSAPTTSSTLLEKSVEITTKPVNGKYFVMQIPRASLRPSAELRLYNRNPDTGEVGFNLTILKPTTDGGTVVAPYKLTAYDES